MAEQDWQTGAPPVHGLYFARLSTTRRGYIGKDKSADGWGMTKDYYSIGKAIWDGMHWRSTPLDNDVFPDITKSADEIEWREIPPRGPAKNLREALDDIFLGAN